MADYHAILRRALAAMPSPNGEVRRAVYEKARTALVTQLKAFDPPLSPSEITQQRLQLEDAIRRVESEAAKGLLKAPPAAPPVKPPVEPVSPAQEPLESPRAVPAAAPPPPPIQPSAVAQPAPPRMPQPVPPPPPPALPPTVEAKPSGEAMKRAVDAAEQLGAATAELGRQARGALDESRTEPAGGVFARTVELPVRKTETEERRKRREKARTGEEGETERKRLPVVVGIAVAVLVFAIGIVALWTQRESISALLGGTPEQVVDITKRPAGEKLAPKNSDRLAGADESAKPSAAKPVPTQTITTTPQLATQPTQAPAQPTQPAPTTEPVQTTPQATEAPKPVPPLPQQQVAMVAQKAILYEEGKIGGQALISPGRIVWQTAPDPTDPKPGAIQLRARIEIPDRKLVVALSMHPNADTSFPASHMVELRFDVPPDFDGKSVAQVPGLILKPTEQARGDGLSGAAAKVADNLFWIALGAAEADRSRNLKLLKERGWIDVPLLYETGRRAILTLEKAGAGDQVFSDALNAWGNGG